MMVFVGADELEGEKKMMDIEKERNPKTKTKRKESRASSKIKQTANTPPTAAKNQPGTVPCKEQQAIRLEMALLLFFFDRETLLLEVSHGCAKGLMRQTSTETSTKTEGVQSAEC